MTSSSATAVAELRTLYEETVPVESDRRFIFSRLLNSISYCEKVGSLGWSVSQLQTGFRLNVGQVEAMTCSFNFLSKDDCELERDVTLVNLRFLLAGKDCLRKVSLTDDGPAEIDEMAYRSVGVQHWCYHEVFYAGVNGKPEPSRATVEEHVAVLRTNHYGFLDLACRTSTGKLRQKSNFVRSHSDSLYSYAKTVGV